MIRTKRIYDFLNYSYYAYRRTNWLLDPRWMWGKFSDIAIHKPIFLLGTQGGGLTLISRMIRRNQQVISVTGNSKYWAGADEMQLVLERILPNKLTGIGKRKVPADDIFGKPRGLVYATDRLLRFYRLQKTDDDQVTATQFRRLLRWIISRYANHPDPRFIDKSQLYTLKVAYLNHILWDCDPKFILITRNPYAVCYRAAMIHLALPDLQGKVEFTRLLEYASQHWANSMAAALEDGGSIKNFLIIRFEDVLKNPKEKILEICDFVELAFNEDMIPREGDCLPFGSLRRNRWYPLREDVNQRYFGQMEPAHAALIAERCGDLADRFGYRYPF